MENAVLECFSGGEVDEEGDYITNWQHQARHKPTRHTLFETLSQSRVLQTCLHVACSGLSQTMLLIGPLQFLENKSTVPIGLFAPTVMLTTYWTGSGLQNVIESFMEYNRLTKNHCLNTVHMWTLDF